MEIYVFPRTIGCPIGVIDTFTSLQWIRRYYKAGEFELVCHIPGADRDNKTNPFHEAQELSNLLSKGNLIWKKGDPEAGYIYYRKFCLDDTGKEIIDVKGKFLTGYLSQRIVWDKMYLSGTSETAMRTLVDKNAINPTIAARTIPLLSLSAAKGFTQTTSYQTPDARENLADALESIGSASRLGHRILFDPVNSQLKFEVYAGLDRTAGQTQNVPAIFSREFEYVLTQEYTDSNDNLKNIALLNGTFTAGEGDAKTETGVSVTVGDAAGLDRYEEYIDGGTQSDSSKDADGKTIAITQADYTNTLTAKGAADIAEHQEVATFDSTIDIRSNLAYKTDFDLGDICPCLNRAWGVEVDARITEITEVYEESGVTITPTFGNSVPTIIDKIKQRTR